MHKRKDIIINQTQFRDEITKALKSEFLQLKRDLRNINSKDPEIVAGKRSLMNKTQKINLRDEINKLFISWKNIYPIFYVWWDDEKKEVYRYRYDDNL